MRRHVEIPSIALGKRLSKLPFLRKCASADSERIEQAAAGNLIRNVQSRTG
jgi:hypothetical protein